MDKFVKRGKPMEEQKEKADSAKTPCRYRNNPDHLARFSHNSPPAKKTKTSSPQPATEHNDRRDGSPGKGTKPLQPVDSDTSSSDGEESDELGVPKMSTEAERASFAEKAFLWPLDKASLALWHIARNHRPSEPLNAFQGPTGLTLCGPFEVLAGRLDGRRRVSKADALRHCRFPLDPPEFQTLAYDTKCHYGYLRDGGDFSPVVVSIPNAPEPFPKLKIMADNILSAMEMIVGEAVEKDASLAPLVAELQSAQEAAGISLASSIAAAEKRKRVAVAATLHGAGIRVPVVNDVGYRPLPETNASLRKILGGILSCEDEDQKKGKLGKVDEMITYVQFANDECDYGEGLELGIDLWMSGSEVLQSRAVQLLSIAYLLLNRPKHAAVLKAHAAKRSTQLEEITNRLFTS